MVVRGRKIVAKQVRGVLDQKEEGQGRTIDAIIAGKLFMSILISQREVWLRGRIVVGLLVHPIAL